MDAAILLVSGVLFLIGLIGLVLQRDIVRVLISLEIMLFAPVLIFCSRPNGGFIAFLAITLSTFTLSAIYAIFNVETQTNAGLHDL